MSHDLCPWWAGYLIDNRVRRWIHDPQRILAPYIRAGMRTLDVGPGMGLFTIEMARIVGPTGRVIAIDVQQRMLDELHRRAALAGVDAQIETRLAMPTRLNIVDLVNSIDFALAFAMVHEVPEPEALLGEVHAALKPGGRFFVAEPRIHVRARAFAEMTARAERVGFTAAEHPHVRWCRAAVFRNDVARRVGH